MSFSIDAHRNPSAQYFANRSFIAKQVGDMRDVPAAELFLMVAEVAKVEDIIVPTVGLADGIINELAE